MATITIPKVRKETDVMMYVKLTDNGVTVDWTSLSKVVAFMYSNEQDCIAGQCETAIAAGDPSTLNVRYTTMAPQFLGVNSLLIRCTYDGMQKSFDVPVLEFVDRTAEATGQVTLDDPELPVSIEVTDVDTSLLDEAIAAALDAAAAAAAAAALVPLDVLTQCQEATIACQDATAHASPIIGENGNWKYYDPETGEYVDSELPSRGIQGPQGEQGPQGIQGNTGSSVDYPFELVNNRTTNDATKALSAAEGKRLGDDLSQLDQEIGDMSDYKEEGYVDVPFTLVPDKYWSYSNLEEVASEGYEYTQISVQPGEKYSISGWNFNSNAPLATARKAGTTTKARAISQATAGKMSGEYTIPNGYDTLYVNGRTGTAPVVIKKWVSVQKSLVEVIEENDAAQEAAVAAVDAKADGVKATVDPMTFSPLNDAYDFDDLTKWTADEGAVLTEGETGVNMVCTYNGTKKPVLYQVVSGINAKNLAVVYLKAHVNSALAGTQFRVLLYLAGAETAVISKYVDLVADTDIEMVLPGAPASGSSFSNPRLYIMVYTPTPAPAADTELCDVDIDYFAVFDDLHVATIDAARAACADGEVFVPVTPTTIGRSWAGIGDSLTAQAKYIPGTMGALMLKSFQNIGTGGQKMSGSAGMCQDATINSISGNPWLITLMGGTNDWAQGVALGTDDSVDTDTYKGALNVAITKIVTAHPTARLVVMGPPYAELESRISSHNWPNAWTNLLGLTVLDYAQAAEDVCAKRGIPCVNFGKLAGWNHENLATFMQTASVHPNDAGGERMAAVLAGFLRGILPTQLEAI